MATRALAGWTRVLSDVHDAGGKIMPQLWHVGTFHKPGSEPNPDAAPFGPSGLAKPGEKIAEPPSEAEIADVVEAYASAAASARRLGFDGIELHGAHGYLIDQFFWEGTNQRTDRYGGSLAARGRFGVEVVAACRRAVGPDFPIVLRYSQWKLQDFNAKLAETPEELATFLAPLAEAGVDVFHCSTRRFWQPAFDGSDLTLAGWTKKLTGKPVIAVGSVGLDNDFVAGLIEQQDRSQQRTRTVGSDDRRRRSRSRGDRPGAARRSGVGGQDSRWAHRRARALHAGGDQDVVLNERNEECESETMRKP